LSESLIITFKSKPPTLQIKSPTDGQSFSKDQNIAEILGTTDPHVRITINNFWAIIDEKNNFSYSLSLKDGENEIKIVALDQAGNKTEKNIKVTYSP
jgi:bacillopeptidase F